MCRCGSQAHQLVLLLTLADTIRHCSILVYHKQRGEDAKWNKLFQKHDLPTPPNMLMNHHWLQSQAQKKSSLLLPGRLGSHATSY